MSTAPIAVPLDTGVPNIVIVPPELVWILVYHDSMTPDTPGCENLAPVEVCSRAQNGSVPRAKNGVNATKGRGGGMTIPVAVGDDTTGTVVLLGDWNRLQLVMKPDIRSAEMIVIFCIQYDKILKLIVIIYNIWIGAS